MPLRTAMAPLPEEATLTTALFARVWPVEKLRADVKGAATSPGNRLR